MDLAPNLRPQINSHMKSRSSLQKRKGIIGIILAYYVVYYREIFGMIGWRKDAFWGDRSDQIHPSKHERSSHHRDDDLSLPENRNGNEAKEYFAKSFHVYEMLSSIEKS